MVEVSVKVGMLNWRTGDRWRTSLKHIQQKWWKRRCHWEMICIYVFPKKCVYIYILIFAIRKQYIYICVNILLDSVYYIRYVNVRICSEHIGFPYLPYQLVQELVLWAMGKRFSLGMIPYLNPKLHWIPTKSPKSVEHAVLFYDLNLSETLDENAPQAVILSHPYRRPWVVLSAQLVPWWNNNSPKREFTWRIGLYTFN